MPHLAQQPVDELLKDCRIRCSRRSGPGGQHRNKVETAVVVEHVPTGLRGEASERRSQEQNRRQAIQRLRIKLALTLRHSPCDVPSTAWQQRLKSGRISVNPQHEEFPGLLAEALDVVYAHQFNLSAAANHLGSTASQLLKLLKSEGEALQEINRARLAAGMSKLH